MRREEYFSFLQETSESVRPTIKNYVEPFKDINKELYDILMVFVKSRLNSRLQKPTLFRLAYELCGGKEWGKVIPAAVAFEFINISSYQANSAFDEKLGVLTKPQKDSQFIASMISRELSFKAASKIERDFSEQLVTKLYSSLSMSNYYIYLAQHYDLNILKVDRIEKYNDERLFFQDYYNRCFYGGGIINGQCAYIGGLLADGKPEQLASLRNFGENFGTGLQIINDLADFVPSGKDEIINRTYQDQFSDLRNGRLTLAFYKLLKNAGLDLDWVLNKIVTHDEFNEEELNEIANILIKERVVEFVKSLAMEYAEKAKRSLSIFQNDEVKSLLCVMTSICCCNKYLKCFSRMAEQIRDYLERETVLSVPYG